MKAKLKSTGEIGRIVYPMSEKRKCPSGYSQVVLPPQALGHKVRVQIIKNENLKFMEGKDKTKELSST